MIFISYAHANEDFVRKLEAKLGEYEFPTWVDYHALRAGELWETRLHDAIDNCEALIVVLSDAAIESYWVRVEVKYAFSLHKTVIPVLHEMPTPPIPEQISALHWVDFTRNRPIHDAYLELVNALSAVNPQPNESNTSLITRWFGTKKRLSRGELNHLYQMASQARQQGNLSLAEDYLKRVVDYDPNLFGGVVASEYKKVREEAHAARVESLQNQADDANLFSDWQQEIKALINIRKISNDNASEIGKRLDIAYVNASVAPLYQNARDVLQSGNESLAKHQLGKVYERAPFFGDPDGIAPKLGFGERLGYVAQKRAHEAETFVTRMQIMNASAKIIDRKDERAKLTKERSKYAGTRQSVMSIRAIGCTVLAFFSPFLAFILAIILYVQSITPADGPRYYQIVFGVLVVPSVVLWVITMPWMVSTGQKMRPLNREIARLDSEIQVLNVEMKSSQIEFANVRRSGRKFERSWWRLW